MSEKNCFCVFHTHTPLVTVFYFFFRRASIPKAFCQFFFFDVHTHTLICVAFFHFFFLIFLESPNNIKKKKNFNNPQKQKKTIKKTKKGETAQAK